MCRAAFGNLEAVVKVGCGLSIRKNQTSKYTYEDKIILFYIKFNNMFLECMFSVSGNFKQIHIRYIG